MPPQGFPSVTAVTWSKLTVDLASEVLADVERTPPSFSSSSLLIAFWKNIKSFQARNWGQARAGAACPASSSTKIPPALESIVSKINFIAFSLEVTKLLCEWMYSIHKCCYWNSYPKPFSWNCINVSINDFLLFPGSLRGPRQGLKVSWVALDSWKISKFSRGFAPNPTGGLTAPPHLQLLNTHSERYALSTRIARFARFLRLPYTFLIHVTAYPIPSPQLRDWLFPNFFHAFLEMFCKKCNVQREEGKFCNECGTILEDEAGKPPLNCWPVKLFSTLNLSPYGLRRQLCRRDKRREWMNIATWQAFLSPVWTRLNGMVFNVFRKS